MHAFEQTMIGKSPTFSALLRAASLTAAADVTLLITGESGTGKELLAQAVHQQSKRKDGPFVAINCAALPDTLAESELFGHKKGAFSGAVNNHKGRIPAANNGTLFLDEVGELSLATQGKLLRFLESGECQSVGSTHSSHSDTRIITATNRDLRSMVQAGQFREDLFYRLNIVPLEMPPLRQRAGDIPLLLNTMLAQSADEHGLEPPRITPPARDVLQQYPWPGNVRELRNFCERIVILFAGSVVDIDNLPLEIRQPQAQSPSHNGAITLPEDGIKLAELERELIKQALQRTRGNRSKAAGLLGLTRDTLLYRLKKYALA